MLDSDHLERVFRKLFPEGRLNRIPKNPEHRDLILALLSLRMMRRYPYSEPELNEFLVEELSSINARVDHVTARRYLVDLGFVKRDTAGARYYLNYLRQQEVLPEPASGSAHSIVAEVIRKAQQARVSCGHT